jgi:WD40 repeat protein
VIGHDRHIESLTYSADGERILTAALDATVGLWDAETGLQLARVLTPSFPVAAAFREDPDRVLIAPLWGGPLYEWNTSIRHAMGFACRVAGRGFTEAEWSAHFGDRPYRQLCPNP